MDIVEAVRKAGEEAAAIVAPCALDEFYGDVTVKFSAGKIVTVLVTQSFRPK